MRKWDRKWVNYLNTIVLTITNHNRLSVAVGVNTRGFVELSLLATIVTKNEIDLSV